MNKKKIRILLTGQCTLHWGRMEFGNIGNYYIIEPFVRELHRVFPGAHILTTFQMSTEFCEREKIGVLPMSLYYGWSDSDLEIALEELGIAEVFNKTGFLPKVTGYIEAVMKSDLVIDFSGDIWGDNANFLGEDRFLVGLCKDRVAQLLGKPTVMLAGSPGPFEDVKTLGFAKEVFRNFNLVTNREPLSLDLLKKSDFDTSKVKSLSCPSFLFESFDEDESVGIRKANNLPDKEDTVIGFTICGWNFQEGPYDKWPREDEDYKPFVDAIEFIVRKLKLKVVLFSHSNGFVPPPEDFMLINGRDFPLLVQLKKILKRRGISDEVFIMEKSQTPKEIKSLVGTFNMVVSGRLHGSVAGLSQGIPTVMIDYGHEPKAHKTKGFAKLLEMDDYVADPNVSGDITDKIKSCWEEKVRVKKLLKKNLPKVEGYAQQNFNLLNKLISR